MIEFKRSLIREIKARPEIWADAEHTYGISQGTESAWKDIQTTLGAPIRKLKNMWSFFCKHYYRILMTKAIERNDGAPKWVHFHDMSFMYKKITEKVRKKMGGISPPLLKPSPTEDRLSCPCCLPGSESTATTQTDPREPESYDCTVRTIQPLKRRQKPVHVSAKGMRFIERERIIDAIKDYPILYDRDATSNLPLWFAWRKVAEKVGIPQLTIQNRWRQFKRRYLDELMKERSSKGPFRSSWPNFEQMSFMRRLMKGDIEELDRIRNEIEVLVKLKKTGQHMTDPESDEYVQSSEDSIQMTEENQSVPVTMDLTSEGGDDVIFLSDEEESAENHICDLSKPLEEEVICIDDDEYTVSQ